MLTIAIPAYKRYDYLNRLLRQIDEQILKENLEEEIEVLICDDSGPEKKDLELITPFLSKKYLRYIDNGENIGIVNNILKVIEESSGKYCLTPGDDEELLADKLVECVSVLKNLPDDNIIAVIFDNEMPDDQLILNCLEAAEKYFWYFGNLGCFIVNTDSVKDRLAYNKRNTIWPQTELVFNAAIKKKSKFYIIKNRIIHSPNHRNNTRYNSFYLLDGGFLSLIRTALNLEDNDLQHAAIRNTNSRQKYFLKYLLYHYIFNDTKQDTEKTRVAISECLKNLKQYIFNESIFLFNLLSKIPKWRYKLILILDREYNGIKKEIKNIENKKIKINDNYT